MLLPLPVPWFGVSCSNTPALQDWSYPPCYNPTYTPALQDWSYPPCYNPTYTPALQDWSYPPCYNPTYTPALLDWSYPPCLRGTSIIGVKWKWKLPEKKLFCLTLNKQGSSMESQGSLSSPCWKGLQNLHSSVYVQLGQWHKCSIKALLLAYSLQSLIKRVGELFLDIDEKSVKAPRLNHFVNKEPVEWDRVPLWRRRGTFWNPFYWECTAWAHFWTKNRPNQLLPTMLEV